MSIGSQTYCNDYSCKRHDCRWLQNTKAVDNKRKKVEDIFYTVNIKECGEHYLYYEKSHLKEY